MQFADRFSEYTYALLRIVSGFLFGIHGVQKIFGVLTDRPTPEVFSQLWIGGLIELIGGLLIMVGFQTRLTAFICSGTMAVAYFQFHWKLQWDLNFFPVMNKGELAVLYCFVFFYMACRGGVKWCIDQK